MRDRETIDSELRRIALGRQTAREHGGQPPSREVDELLDELLAHNSGASHTDAEPTYDIDFVPEAWLRNAETRAKSRRRKGALHRWGLLAALPLSLIAVIAVVVVLFAARHQDSSTQAQPTEPPPSAAAPKPVAPNVPVPHIDIADIAFVGALKQEGVPVPSQEYVVSQGHAVCDFLARQPNFADAAGFVQRSSIWDANQSAQVTAGAIVAYCPQAQPAVGDMSPAYQSALSDLQAIEGKLQGIQGDLQGIQGNLDPIIPSHP